jgi:hypothetical protein
VDQTANQEIARRPRSKRVSCNGLRTFACGRLAAKEKAEEKRKVKKKEEEPKSKIPKDAKDGSGEIHARVNWDRPNRYD